MFDNSVHLMGRLTADPEIKQAGQTNVCNFTVAINRPVKKDADSETDFIRCVVFGISADFLEKYFGKGDKIGVEGRLQVRNYTDKDGNKRSSTEVIVNNISFINDKGTSAAKTANKNSHEDEDDELPV